MSKSLARPLEVSQGTNKIELQLTSRLGVSCSRINKAEVLILMCTNDLGLFSPLFCGESPIYGFNYELQIHSLLVEVLLPINQKRAPQCY